MNDIKQIYHYRFLEKIGDGAFGEVFKSQHCYTHSMVAIKCEEKQANTHLLKNESIIYQYLKGLHGIPVLRWFGQNDTHSFMVMDLLGYSLQQVVTTHGKLSLPIVRQLMTKMLYIVQSIHTKGLVHRDLKPAHFLFDATNDGHALYLVDFGLCKKSAGSNLHSATTSFVGSMNYASIRAHHWLELGIKDDLESLGYIMIFLYCGTLPWSNMTRTEEIVDAKVTLLDHDLPDVLVKYLKYVRKLSVQDVPDYERLIHIMSQQM
jgi:serine/threonine protein kinase